MDFDGVRIEVLVLLLLLVILKAQLELELERGVSQARRHDGEVAKLLISHWH